MLDKRHMIIGFAAFCLTATLFIVKTTGGTNPSVTSTSLGEGYVWEWDETYGGADDDWARSVIETNDGGYAIIGPTYSFTTGQRNLWLVKTDSAGNMQWNQTYGGTNHDIGVSVVQTSDGGYAIAGRTDSFGAGDYDFWLVKTDSAGNMQWNQTYGGTNYDCGSSVVQTIDGGYAIAGRTDSFGAGIDDFWLVKTDSAGNMQWNQTYGGTKIDWAQSVVHTGDGGYAIAGWTDSFGAGDYDFWLVKMRARVQRDLAVTLDAPTLLELGDSSLLDATVTNWGLSNETDVELFLLVNGTIADSVTIPELLIDSSYTLSYLWTPTVEAIYNVTAYAPPVSGENVTTNNFATKMVNVIKRTVVYVDPETTTAWLGETFVIDVKVAEVNDLGGYEFKLFWNTTLLDCVGSTINRIWHPNDFIAKDEILDNYNATHGRYWCGYASSSASSFSGNTTLVSLTFEVTEGSMEGRNCTLDLCDIVLANPEAEIIYGWDHKDSPYDGYVTCMRTYLEGDINHDGIVDIVDIVIVALAFGSRPGDDNWNPQADIAPEFGLIDIVDIVLVAIHFGETG